MSDDLPLEVLFNIFLKVPLKTLILCTCVSKSWHSVISDPTFISAHLNQSTIRKEKFLILKRISGTGSNKKELYSLHHLSETLDLHQELKLPFSEWNENSKLVGVCNGLVCLFRLNILLWNPSIRRSVAVPWTSDIVTIQRTPNNYALGFGFDSCANDFKVVRLLYYKDNTQLFNCKKPPRVEVYELRTGSWRGISSKAPRCETIKSEWTQAFVNGAVHWVAYKETVDGYRCFILRFHMVDECFGVIALPGCLLNYSPYNLKVAVVGGALAIMLCGWYCFDTFVSSIWVLEKYEEPESWTKIIEFHPSQGLGMFLRFGENGMMLMTSKNGEVVLYNQESQLVKGLGICGAEDSFYLDTYVESLALLNEGK